MDGPLNGPAKEKNFFCGFPKMLWKNVVISTTGIQEN